MKAGKTDLDVNTVVRVTHVADADEQDLVGAVGRITHPFPGLMWPGQKYTAGLYLTEAHGDTPKGGTVNLCPGDRFEVVEPDLDPDLDDGEVPVPPGP